MRTTLIQIAIATALLLTPTAPVVADDGGPQNSETRLKTRLAGAAIQKPASISGGEEVLFQTPSGTARPDSWSPDGRFILYIAVHRTTVT